MLRWLIAFAIAVKVLYTLGLAVWSPAPPPHAAPPSGSIVVCESSAGPGACVEVEAPAAPTRQTARG